MCATFNPPPNWPRPPTGWSPPPGWQPNPAWGPPPDGWQLWIDLPDEKAADDNSSEETVLDQLHTATTEPVNSNHRKSIPLFRARAKARELSEEVDKLHRELRHQRKQMETLGVLELAQLEKYREELTEDVRKLRTQLEQERAQHAATLAAEVAEAEQQRTHLREGLNDLRQQLVRTQDTALLQEAGVYEYRHPLDHAVAYQSELSRLKDAIKTMVRKDGGAVLATTNWTVNGSVSQGQAMVRDVSKLLLRAYNAEADNLVRSLKPYKLDSAVDRLTGVAATIAKLGRSMDIKISDEYHRTRVRELELTADFLAKQAEEKEREREERARLREEQKAQREFERERARLEKERQHHQNALDALIATGDDAGAERLTKQLAEITDAINDVDYRAANARAGYVYVISNLGAFGEQVVKIGMTRRLDPHDRIRELSDASVPFNFDVHALFFSPDAVEIESQMHERLADRRVNRVNTRREFFYATPREAKEHLLALTGVLLHFDETPEALEFRQSRPSEQRIGRHTASLAS